MEKKKKAVNTHLDVKQVKKDEPKWKNQRKKRWMGYLGISDVGVLADLGGDRGAELGDGDDIVEVVDLHDGGEGSAGHLEEFERPLASLLHARRVRRNLHHLQRRQRRHDRFFLPPHPTPHLSMDFPYCAFDPPFGERRIGKPLQKQAESPQTFHHNEAESPKQIIK